MNAAIIVQEDVVEPLLLAVLADGRVLLERLPRVAKPRSIKTLDLREMEDMPENGFSFLGEGARSF